MDQNIGLLQAKSVIGLLKLGIGPVDVTREITRYAVHNQDAPGGITELASLPSPQPLSRRERGNIVHQSIEDC